MVSQLLAELKQTKPFVTPESEAAVSISRTAALVEHTIGEMLRVHRVTQTQYNVLRILRGAGPAGMCRNDVRDRLVARVPDATRLLDRMAEMGLVTRDRDTPDRRVVSTRITQRGLDLLERIDQPMKELHAKQFGHLGPKKLAQLIDLLAEVRRAEMFQ